MGQEYEVAERQSQKAERRVANNAIRIWRRGEVYMDMSAKGRVDVKEKEERSSGLEDIVKGIHRIK